MTKILIPFPVFRAFDNTGIPLAGGKLYTYAAGTTTPLASYIDETGGTPNTNPVILDSTGSANLWLGTAPYKFVLKDADDVVQWTVDNIGAQPPTIVNVIDYGAVGDGITDDQPAFAAAAGAAGSWGTVLVPRPAVSYNLGSDVSDSVFWIFMGSAAASGVGTLTGIQIQQQDGGALAIINPAGSDALILDSGGNWSITGTSLSFAGNTTLTGTLTVSDQVHIPASYTKGLNFGSGFSSAGSLYVDDGSHNTACSALQLNTLLGLGADNNWFLGYYNHTGNGVGPQAPFLSVGRPYATPVILKQDGGFGVVPIFSTYGASFSDSAWVNRSAKSPFNDFTFVMSDGGGSGTSGVFTLQRNWTNQSSSAYLMYYDNSNGIVFGGNASGYANDIPLTGYATASTKANLTLDDRSAGATSQKILIFKRGGTEVGSVSETNSATTYNTSSDYRLKDIIAPIHNALQEVNKVPAYLFKWKASGETADGFIAHEVQDVAPYAVQGEKDGKDMQQLDYSKLVPLLWAAVQELSAKVKELESKSV